MKRLITTSILILLVVGHSAWANGDGYVDFIKPAKETSEVLNSGEPKEPEHDAGYDFRKEFIEKVKVLRKWIRRNEESKELGCRWEIQDSGYSMFKDGFFIFHEGWEPFVYGNGKIYLKREVCK